MIVHKRYAMNSESRGNVTPLLSIVVLLSAPVPAADLLRNLLRGIGTGTIFPSMRLLPQKRYFPLTASTALFGAKTEEECFSPFFQRRIGYVRQIFFPMVGH